MTSHYLNQCLVIVKFQWNFNQNTKLFIHENVCESVICEMGAILSRKLTKLELQNLSQLYNWRFLYVARYHLHNFYSVNTLRPKQNGQHFADDIFKRIFFNENVWILIKISLKYVPQGPINKIPALFQKIIYFLVGPWDPWALILMGARALRMCPIIVVFYSLEILRCVPRTKVVNSWWFHSEF